MYILIGLAIVGFALAALVLGTISTSQLNGSITLANGVIVDAHINTVAAIQRAKLQQDSLKPYVVPLTDLRKYTDLTLVLPNAASGSDLGLISGTYASASPCIETGDLKAAGATIRYARFQLRMPMEFVAGQTVTLRAHAGMVTTVADTSATILFEAYKSDGYAGIGSNLVSTAATTINSLSAADKDFVVDGSGLNPGDVLDVRVRMTITDAATGTVVKGRIGAITLLCDVQG
jgi:hypothetical protein